MAWLKEGQGPDLPTGKGKRLIIVHAITRDGPLVTFDDDEYPIEEDSLKGVMSTLPTCEWI